MLLCVCILNRSAARSVSYLSTCHAFFVSVPSDTPGYFLYVKEPIDISTIEARLDAGQYASLVPLEAAFKLMYDNCDAYNDPMINQTGAQFLKCSRESRKKAEKRFGKIRKKLLVRRVLVTSCDLSDVVLTLQWTGPGSRDRLETCSLAPGTSEAFSIAGYLGRDCDFITVPQIVARAGDACETWDVRLTADDKCNPSVVVDVPREVAAPRPVGRDCRIRRAGKLADAAV